MPVESVALNKIEASIEVGAGETLIATVLPENASDKSMTWESDAEAVATVEDGVVTGVSAGEATISVTTTDGEKTATCAVTVTETDGAYTQQQLEAMTKNQITTLAEDLKYTLEGITSSSTKAEIIAAFLAAQTAAE